MVEFNIIILSCIMHFTVYMSLNHIKYFTFQVHFILHHYFATKISEFFHFICLVIYDQTQLNIMLNLSLQIVPQLSFT